LEVIEGKVDGIKNHDSALIENASRTLTKKALAGRRFIWWRHRATRSLSP
jgi:hypothetical protein